MWDPIFHASGGNQRSNSFDPSVDFVCVIIAVSTLSVLSSTMSALEKLHCSDDSYDQCPDWAVSDAGLPTVGGDIAKDLIVDSKRLAELSNKSDVYLLKPLGFEQELPWHPPLTLAKGQHNFSHRAHFSAIHGGLK